MVIQDQIVSLKNFYMQAALHKLNKLYLYVYPHICSNKEKEIIEFEKDQGPESIERVGRRGEMV